MTAVLFFCEHHPEHPAAAGFLGCGRRRRMAQADSAVPSPTVFLTAALLASLHGRSYGLVSGDLRRRRLTASATDLRRREVRGPGGGRTFSVAPALWRELRVLGEKRLTDTARAAMDDGATNHSQETVDEVAAGVGASLGRV